MTRADAAARATRVGRVSYALDLDLRAGSGTYGGVARLRFPVAGQGDLFLDFRGGEVTRLTVNGRAVTPERPGHRILLPGSLLGATTEVEVAYENEYDRGGDGFHHFVDPEDGAEYAYSNFEPFEAHRLFPCFDQPDLKGSYSVTVRAPGDWAIIANAPAAAVVPVDDGRREHRFAPTPPISTYLVAVIAGPFTGIRSLHRGTPLGIWTRRSLAPFLDPAEIFEITKQGLDFYAALFDHPFPFGKYDQIFVPEFNSGAMENVGAVTFSESYVFRDPPTDTQRLMRAETALHELAHMWFGDLTTMRWWDDLWLNESFATYASNLALAEATRFDGAWRAFHADMKRWGYQADARSTTHPISGVVPDTDATFYNFDGITYGKGASVIKQLAAEVGQDAFRAGIRTYFRRHAWGNATLADFLAALEEGAGRPLRDWSRGWLETASLNTIEAAWTARDGRVERLQLTQEAPEDHPTLRPHALELALVRAPGEGPAEIDVVSARLDGAETWVEAAVGRPAPDLVFPNHGDHGYARVLLDPVSLAAAPRLLGRIADPLLRQLLWGTLWEMVRCARHSSLAFLELVRARLPDERDDQILLAALDASRGTLARYVPEERRLDEARRFVALAVDGLEGLPEGDLRTLWLRAAIGAAAEPADVATLARLVDQEPGRARVQVDREMRWSVAALAVAHDLPGARERVAAERAADQSDRGERATLRAETGAPDAVVKAAAWERIHGEGYGSFQLTQAAMLGFNHAHQAELLAPYVDRFFDGLPAVAAERDHPFLRAYVTALFPAYRPEPAHVERARAMADERGDELPSLRRLLLEAADDLERAIVCRSFASLRARTHA
ncbi:MAG: aminopeptidase N [Chloroflexota bacterium]